MQTSQISRKSRLEAVKTVFILRRTEDSQQRQQDIDIVRVRSLSYEKHLTNLGIEPKDYNEVYELSVQAHAEKGASGPFGIDSILIGARRFLETKNVLPKFNKERKIKTECPTCMSTGLRFDESGKILYELKGSKREALKCLDCDE